MSDAAQVLESEPTKESEPEEGASGPAQNCLLLPKTARKFIFPDLGDTKTYNSIQN